MWCVQKTIIPGIILGILGIIMWCDVYKLVQCVQNVYNVYNVYKMCTMCTMCTKAVFLLSNVFLH